MQLLRIVLIEKSWFGREIEFGTRSEVLQKVELREVVTDLHLQSLGSLKGPAACHVADRVPSPAKHDHGNVLVA